MLKKKEEEEQEEVKENPALSAAILLKVNQRGERANFKCRDQGLTVNTYRLLSVHKFYIYITLLLI